MQHNSSQKAEVLRSQEMQKLARTAGDFVQRLSQEQSWFADQGSASQQAPAFVPLKHKRALADKDLCERIAEVKVSQRSEDRAQHRPKRHKNDPQQAIPLRQQAPHTPHAGTQDNNLPQQASTCQPSSTTAQPATATVKQEVSMEGGAAPAQQSIPGLHHADQEDNMQPERHSSEDSDVSILARSSDAVKPEDLDTSSDQPGVRMPMHDASRPEPAAHQPAAVSSPAPGSATKPIVIDGSSDDEDEVPLSVRKGNMEAAATAAAAAAVHTADQHTAQAKPVVQPAPASINPASTPLGKLSARRKWSRAAQHGSPARPAGSASTGHVSAAAGTKQHFPTVHTSGLAGASSSVPFASPLWRAAQAPLPGDDHPPAAARAAPATARKTFAPRMPSRLGSVLDGVPMKRRHDIAASEHAADSPPFQRVCHSIPERTPAAGVQDGQAARAPAAAQEATNLAPAAAAAAAGGKPADTKPTPGADLPSAHSGPSRPDKAASQARSPGQARTKASVRSGRSAPAATADADTGAQKATNHRGTADDQPKAGQKRPAASPATPRMFKAARYGAASADKEGSPMDIDEPGQPSFDPAADEAQPGQDMHADPTSKPQAVPSRFNPQAPRAARLLRSAVAQGPAAPKSGANPSQRTHLPSTFLPRREQAQRNRQEVGARLNVSSADWSAVRSSLRSHLPRPAAAPSASVKSSAPAGRARTQPEQRAQPAEPVQQAQQATPQQDQQHHPAASASTQPQPPTSPPRPAFGFKFKPMSPPHRRSAPADADPAATHATARPTTTAAASGQPSKHRTASQAGLAGSAHAEARAPKRQRQHSPPAIGSGRRAGGTAAEEEVEVVREMPGRGSRTQPVDLSCASPQHPSAQPIGSSAQPAGPSAEPARPAAAATARAREEQTAPSSAAGGGSGQSSAEAPAGGTAAPEVAVRADREGGVWADAQKAEWEARQAEILRQQKDTQEQKRRRRLAAEQEQRSKARVEELRRSLAVAEQQSSERDQLRTRVRAELQARMGFVYSPAHLLQKLSIPLRGGPTFSPAPAQLRATFKAAMLQWHPDRHTSSPPEQQARAEEMFKILNQWSSKVPSA